MSGINDFPAPTFSQRILVIVGAFGSGKSEVAVNLARHLAASGTEPVAIADLDIVNPYFRSRGAAKELAGLGIKSLIPPGAWVDADLPIIVPEIKGAIESASGTVVLDVGGDDDGATVLSSMHDAFVPGSYEMLLILNASRPFTSDVAGGLKIIREIEAASRLKVTGIVSNAHLIEDTTPEVIIDGLKLARDVCAKTGLPLVFVSVFDKTLVTMSPKDIGSPVLPINRSLLKPWERKSSSGAN